MDNITIKSSAIEYAVIELDTKIVRLTEEQTLARHLALQAVGQYPDAIIEYWDNRQAAVQVDIDECKAAFDQLRAVLVSLADRKTVNVTVLLEEQ